MVKEVGFGSPDDLGGYDAGFGSPDDWGPGDTGFGSPSDLTGATLGGSREIADDGGEILELVGTFLPGPYKVWIVSAAGEPILCYGAVQGQGSTCWPNAAKNRLPFVTPPLPLGVYSVQVENETIPDTLTVVYRTWKTGVFSLRTRWPQEVYPTGPQSVKREMLLT